MADAIFFWRCVWAFICWLPSIAVLAGNSTSGGGWVVGDSQNPWFISNTERVTYCIRIDSNSIGLSRDRVAVLIAEAFDSWRREFSYAERAENSLDVGHPNAVVELATQRFELKSECSSETDIAFQFGVLDADQAAYLHKPREAVAATVRTDYDEKYLRGKGYIYFSPQAGPLRLDGEQFGDDFWSYADGKLLGRVILHELGHVFGLPHHGPSEGLMTAGFPERVVSRWYRTLGFAERPFELEVFKFHQRSNVGYCVDQGEENVLARRLGVSDHWRCVRLHITETALSVYVKRDRAALDWVLAGSAQYPPCNGRCPSTNGIHVLHMQLSPRQLVFPWSSPRRLSLVGPAASTRQLQTRLRNVLDGSDVNLLLELAPARFSLSVIHTDGQIEFGVMQEFY